MERVKKKRLPGSFDVIIVYSLILTYAVFAGFFLESFSPTWASLVFTSGLFFIPALYVFVFRFDFKNSFGISNFCLQNIQNKVKKSFLAGAFFLALGVLFVELVGSVLVSPFISDSGTVPQLLQERILSEPFVVGVLLVAIFPAVFEELLCRGFILKALLRRLSGVKSIVLCSFLFALLHFDPVRIPFTFIAGLSLSWVAWKTGSVLLPISMHFFHNFVLFSIVKFNSPVLVSIEMSEKVSNFNFSTIYSFPILFFCACVVGIGVFFVLKGIRSVLSGCKLELNAHNKTGL